MYQPHCSEGVSTANVDCVNIKIQKWRRIKIVCYVDILLLKAKRRNAYLILTAFYLFGRDFFIRKVQHFAIRYRLTKIINYKSCRCWVAKIARGKYQFHVTPF